MHSIDNGVLVGMVSEGIFLLVLIVSNHVKTMGRLRELEVKVRQMEKQDERVIEKLDEIKDDISEIKVSMQNKQDRAR